MKTVIASLFALIVSFAPLATLAQSSSSDEVRHLAAVAAALSAQATALSTDKSLACALLPTKKAVHANEPFVLAWGSVGAMNPGDDPNRSMWPANGTSVTMLPSVGTWTYHFTFFAKTGESVECTTEVYVVDDETVIL